MPSDAEFGIRIDFRKGESNPQRVFQATIAMIGALQRLDRALCASIDVSIEPLMVLEEIEAGSLVVWLKNILHRVDDEALRTLEWKPIIGRYLVKAKYAYVNWANRAEGERTLATLARDLQAIAAETDVKRFPDYAPPSTAALADATRGVEQAKSYLIDGDKISYVVPDEPPADFELAVQWTDQQLHDMLVKETVKGENQPMTLIVKKPDYLGKSKWDFRHGGRQISANISDSEWLAAFQSRKIDVRPGDALRCLVNIEHHYGYDNELITETYIVTKVVEVLENQISQREMEL
jgi:hypothetical protein